MPKQLSPQEVQTRFSRLANLEKMYANQVEANQRLKQENKQLKARVKQLEQENKDLRDKVEKLEVELETLKTMIFKKTNQ